MLTETLENKIRMRWHELGKVKTVEEATTYRNLSVSVGALNLCTVLIGVYRTQLSMWPLVLLSGAVSAGSFIGAIKITNKLNAKKYRHGTPEELKTHYKQTSLMYAGVGGSFVAGTAGIKWMGDYFAGYGLRVPDGFLPELSFMGAISAVSLGLASYYYKRYISLKS